MEQLFTPESVSLITIGLLVIGFAKFIIYYKSFNIPIIDYIEPSEIITLFADNIATSLTITTLLFWPHKGIILPYIQHNKYIDSNLFNRLSNYLDLMSTFLLLAITLFLLMMIFLFFRPKIYNFELITYIIATPIIVILIPLITIEIGININNKLFQEVLTSLSLIVSFSSLIMLSTFNEIRKVKYGYYSNTIVELENEIIVSNDSRFYVGKTKSFFFFYSTSDRASMAYSCSKLKCIKYTPNS